MNNRFRKIIDKINEEECLNGILVKRIFPNDKSGMVADIQMEISDAAMPNVMASKSSNPGEPVWDAENSTFTELFMKQERMVILGAGHVANKLSVMGKMIGFEVIVVDDRLEYANPQRFPDADGVVCAPFDKAIDMVKPRKNDYVVIVTREHGHDAECIRSLMKYDETIYTGMMGSKRRVSIVFDTLKQEGYDSERLGRIHSPIGLDIGAKTIEEIDISIIAQIVQIRRQDSLGRIIADRSDHDMNGIKQLGTIEKSCAIATILHTEGSTPRTAGAVMAVFDNGDIYSSVGGGFAESEVIDKAKKIIGTKKYEIITVSMAQSHNKPAGMVCGGSATVLIEDFDY